MVLAFFIDQIQEAACGLFQAALKKVATRRTLWEKVRSYFHTYFVKSWEDLFTAIKKRIAVPLPVSRDTSQNLGKVRRGPFFSVFLLKVISVIIKKY